MSKTLLNQIAFLVGAISIFCAGMIYILLADLVLGVRSPWLFVAIVIALGAVVCLVLSDRYKDKPKTMYILKSVGTFLTLLFIGFMMLFMLSALNATLSDSSDEYELQLFALAKLEKKSQKVYTIAISVASAVLAGIGLIGQALNIGLTVSLRKADEQ